MNACIDACTVERIKLMWPHERLVERSLSTDDLETFFGTIVVHCQYKPQLVALSGVLSAPYCIGGHIASVAILHRWPYCIGGRIASVAVLHQWLYHAWGHIASVTISHRWPYHIGGHIASVAILHRWSYCVCMHVRMHMHGCMHAAGMPVYAGGMRNIEYRTKLRRTAQEQLGFSISSSRSSKYAQSVHTAQKMQPMHA